MRSKYSVYCKLQIVKNCEILFNQNLHKKGFNWKKITTKKAMRRSYGCSICVDRLHKLGLTIGRYRTMKEPTIKEKMQWDNNEKGTIVLEVEKPIYNDKEELVGTKTEVTKCITTRYDIEQGLNVVKERVRNNTKKMVQIKNRLDSIKKKPEVTEFAEKIEAALHQIALRDQMKKWNDEYGNLKKQFNEDQVFIYNREKMLSTAPI